MSLKGARGALAGRMLDEDTFADAATNPAGFQAGDTPSVDPARVSLKAYAVGIFKVE